VGYKEEECMFLRNSFSRLELEEENKKSKNSNRENYNQWRYNTVYNIVTDVVTDLTNAWNIKTADLNDKKKWALIELVAQYIIAKHWCAVAYCLELSLATKLFVGNVNLQRLPELLAAPRVVIPQDEKKQESNIAEDLNIVKKISDTAFAEFFHRIGACVKKCIQTTAEQQQEKIKKAVDNAKQFVPYKEYGLNASKKTHYKCLLFSNENEGVVTKVCDQLYKDLDGELVPFLGILEGCNFILNWKNIKYRYENPFDSFVSKEMSEIASDNFFETEEARRNRLANEQHQQNVNRASGNVANAARHNPSH
jgi:hypothetical protein